MTTRGKTWLAVAALLLFYTLALASLVNDSPTMDEQNHIARGLAYLRTGDPRLSVEHPPVANVLSALPLHALLDVQLPLDHPSWERPEGWYEFAQLMLWEYNHDVTRMVFLARLPIVFLTMGLALAAFHFARELWGTLPGLLSFFFVLFDPNILAHGRYATTDVGGATFVLLALLCVWRLWQAPNWNVPRLLTAGLALGLAFGTKLSALAFAPILILMALLPLYPGALSWRRAIRRLAQLALAGVLALFVVWAIFGFEWGPLHFESTWLAPLVGINGPLPTFSAGVEQILFLSRGGRPAFLLGETSPDGFAAYFPVAFLVKTPLPTLLFLIIALGMLFHRRTTSPDRKKALFLLLPSLLFFTLSLTSRLNIGYRHLLLILPPLYIFIAGMVFKVGLRHFGAAHDRSVQQRLRQVAPFGLTVLLLLSTLAIHPHYLSYFNRLAGGPDAGYRILVDSNVDWGQDLLRLKEWMAEKDVDSVNLSWFGSADPAYYDIQYRPLPGLPRHFDLWWNVPFDTDPPEPGVYAISVSNIWELPLQDDKHVFSWFRSNPPDDRVGYSILIYDVN